MIRRLAALFALLCIGLVQSTALAFSITVTAASTYNEMAGCPMYPGDNHLVRDITSMAVSSTDASDKSASSSPKGSWNAYGNLGSLGDGPYLLHVQSDGSPPTTVLHDEVEGQSVNGVTFTQTGHNPPQSSSSITNFPIGGFTNQNSLTNGSGDMAMEIIAQSGYSGLSGHSSANGCEVIDGYFLTFIGNNGVYGSSNMWAAYTACSSDPNGNMVSETCNSNADLSGIEIAGALMAEQVVSPQPSGWSTLNHALLAETPCDGGSGPLCESSKKMRLRVCGDDDAVTNDNNPGVNCVNLPNSGTSPQAYAIGYALRHYGLFLSDNGCCFNIARNYTPISGDTDMNYSQINSFITGINSKDFDEMVSNN